MKMLLSLTLLMLLLVSPAQAVDVFTTLYLDATVESNDSAAFIQIKDKNFNDLPALVVGGLTAGTDPATLKPRVSFGEARVDYFVASAFDLVCYTDDGDAATAVTGLQGALDATKYMNFKVWTPNFGLVNAVAVDYGNNTAGAQVPNPRDNVLWADPTNALWAPVGEENTTEPDGSDYRVVLSSSAPSPVNPNENQIQAPLFPTYFGVNLFGLKGQTYRGQLIYELVTK